MVKNLMQNNNDKKSAGTTAVGTDAPELTRIVEALKHKPGALLPILHEVQNQQGYISSQAKTIIARELNLSVAEVHGVVTFYSHFRSTPPGAHTLQICRAESCQAMGSRALELHAKQRLGIDYHQTSPDGQVTLEPVYCLGNCACSPAIRLDDDVYGRVDNQLFDTLVDELAIQTIAVK